MTDPLDSLADQVSSIEIITITRDGSRIEIECGDLDDDTAVFLLMKAVAMLTLPEELEYDDPEEEL